MARRSDPNLALLARLAALEARLESADRDRARLRRRVEALEAGQPVGRPALPPPVPVPAPAEEEPPPPTPEPTPAEFHPRTADEMAVQRAAQSVQGSTSLGVRGVAAGRLAAALREGRFPHLVRVQVALDSGDGEHGVLAALAASPTVRRVAFEGGALELPTELAAERWEELSLVDCGLSSAHALAAWELPALRRLDVHGNALPGLALPSSVPKLTFLSASRNPLGDEGLALLLRGAPLPALTELHVAHCGLTALPLSLFAQLRAVDAVGNRLESPPRQLFGRDLERSAAAAQRFALVGAPRQELLRAAAGGAPNADVHKLVLDEVYAGDVALLAAALRAGGLPSLFDLRLGQPVVPQEDLARGLASGGSVVRRLALGVRSRIEAPLADALRNSALVVLDLRDCALRALPERMCPASLEVLVLAHNRFKGAAVPPAVGDARLVELHLDDNPQLRAAGVAEALLPLLAAGQLGRLRVLGLDKCRCSVLPVPQLLQLRHLTDARPFDLPALRAAVEARAVTGGNVQIKALLVGAPGAGKSALAAALGRVPGFVFAEHARWTRGALVLLAWDVRAPVEDAVLPWLQLVEARLPGAVVQIVATHVDQLLLIPGMTLGRGRAKVRAEPLIGELMERVRALGLNLVLRDAVPVSGLSLTGVQALSALLQEEIAEMDEFQHVRAPVSAQFAALRALLRRFALALEVGDGDGVTMEELLDEDVGVWEGGEGEGQPVPFAEFARLALAQLGIEEDVVAAAVAWMEAAGMVFVDEERRIGFGVGVEEVVGGAEEVVEGGGGEAWAVVRLRRLVPRGLVGGGGGGGVWVRANELDGAELGVGDARALAQLRETVSARFPGLEYSVWHACAAASASVGSEVSLARAGEEEDGEDGLRPGAPDSCSACRLRS